jgi:hypothetical protein
VAALLQMLRDPVLPRPTGCIEDHIPATAATLSDTVGLACSKANRAVVALRRALLSRGFGIFCREYGHSRPCLTTLRVAHNAMTTAAQLLLRQVARLPGHTVRLAKAPRCVGDPSACQAPHSDLDCCAMCSMALCQGTAAVCVAGVPGTTASPTDHASVATTRLSAPGIPRSTVAVRRVCLDCALLRPCAVLAQVFGLAPSDAPRSVRSRAASTQRGCTIPSDADNGSDTDTTTDTVDTWDTDADDLDAMMRRNSTLYPVSRVYHRQGCDGGGR